MKKMTKIISFLLTFALIFAVSAPSFAWDTKTTGECSITIQSYKSSSVTEAQHQPNDLEGRTFAVYRILNGTKSSDGQHVAYSIPDDMEDFYQNYDWTEKKYPSSISSVFGKEVASADEVTSMSGVFLQKKRISDIDIMKAIADLDGQVGFVGAVDNENSDIMPIESLADKTGEDLRQALLERLGKYETDSADLENFADQVLNYLINIKQFGEDGAPTIYRAVKTAGPGQTQIEFEKLPYGYYIVAELKDGAHLHTTTTLLTNVFNADTETLYTKDVEPTVEKYIDDSKNESTGNDLLDPGKKGNIATNVGDTVEYRIIANLPDVEGFDKEGENAYKFTVEDTLGSGLEFNINNTDGTIDLASDPQIKLTLFKDNSQAGESITPLSTAIDSATIESVEGEIKGTKLTLNFKSSWIYENGIKEGETASTKIPYIVIQYSANVTNEAVFGTEGNINDVVIKYNDVYNHNADHTSAHSTVKTYLISINLKKADFDTQDLLKGAKFTLRNNSNQYVTTVDATNNNLITEWGDSADAAYEFEVSDSAAGLAISGLEAGTYYLKETQAPDGYYPLSDEIAFEVNAQVSATGELDGPNITNSTNSEYLDVSAGNGSITVLNKGVESQLPGTGGIGRVIIYTLGSILVIGAVVLLILKKRSAKNNA